MPSWRSLAVRNSNICERIDQLRSGLRPNVSLDGDCITEELQENPTGVVGRLRRQADHVGVPRVPVDYDQGILLPGKTRYSIALGNDVINTYKVTESVEKVSGLRRRRLACFRESLARMQL